MNSSIEAGLALELPPTRWISEGGGPRLAFSAYPAENPWLHILISHGLGEHRGWYHHVASTFQAAGISAYTFDHFHHGVSEGRPGDVPEYSVLAGGVRLALEQGMAPFCSPDEPKALLGHSNGGLAVLQALPSLSKGLISAVVLCNPLLGLPRWLVRWGMFPLRIMNNLNSAWMVPMRNYPPHLTGNRTIWGDYRRDQLRLRRVSARFVLEMAHTAGVAHGEASCQGLPLLLLCAGLDRIVDRSATMDWFQRLDTHGKWINEYPGLRHELFNEIQWRSILADITAWLRERMQERSGIIGEAAG